MSNKSNHNIKVSLPITKQAIVIKPDRIVKDGVKPLCPLYLSTLRDAANKTMSKN